MKKQLVLLSCLVGVMSLWGMDEGYRAVMELDNMPIIQQALADTPEKKEALSFKLFKQFHQKAFEYFKEGQTNENRLAILIWISNWLPLFTVLHNQQELYNIKRSLGNSEQILNDFDQAAEFFAYIYVIYLRRNPEQLCKVLSAYFHMSFIENG